MLSVIRFIKRKTKRAIKDVTLSCFFPLAYRYFARKPVAEGRVLFLETKEQDMPDSFELLYRRLADDPSKKPRFISLAQNHVSYMQYLQNCVHALHDISRAEVVVLSDASDLVSCIKMRSETKAVQLWHACGAFKRWGMSTAELKFGGSREDLWVFNAERIARAAYRCKTPLISAIGHEIDFTILDFVADQRAPTPSAAAELAVPDRAEYARKLFILEENIHNSIQNKLELCYNRLDETAQAFSRPQMQGQLVQRQQQLQMLTGQLSAAARAKQQSCARQMNHAASLAASLNPYGVLARGYALVQDEKGRICAPDALRAGQSITLCGAKNRIRCTVDAVEEPNESTQKL